MKNFIIGYLLLLSVSVQSEEVLTHTWSLDPNNNSADFKLLTQFDPASEQSWAGYLTPSTTNLTIENFNEAWLDDNHHADKSIELSVLFRTRGAVKKILQPYSETIPVFQNWPFIRKFIFFGGEAPTGAHVVAPDPIYVDNAHRNGVKIYGTVFLAPTAYGGNPDMAWNLFGSERDDSYVCKPEDSAEIAGQNWVSSQLGKLADIARMLKLDGWYINLESVNDNSFHNNLLLKSIGRQTSCLFPKFNAPKINATDKEPVEFIIYMPTGGSSYGIPADSYDSNILNVSHSVEGNTNGVNAGAISNNFNPNNHKYLLFLDQPFWQNMPGTSYVQLRYDAAKSTSCQFFKGVTNQSGTWNGFAYYAKARYPITLDPTNILCAGDYIANDKPAPEYVLSIKMPARVDLSVSTIGQDVQNCLAGETCRITFKEPGTVNFLFSSGFRFRKERNSWEGEVKYIKPDSLWLNKQLTPYVGPEIPLSGALCNMQQTKTVIDNLFGDGLPANMYEGRCTFTFSKEVDEYGFWKTYLPMLNGSMKVETM